MPFLSLIPMLINTSHGDPPVSFHAHHEAPRLALSRKSPPCPSQANHASAFSSCWHGLMQQEVYRASYVSLSLPSSLTLQPRPQRAGEREGDSGRKSLSQHSTRHNVDNYSLPALRPVWGRMVSGSRADMASLCLREGSSGFSSGPSRQRSHDRKSLI